MHVRMDTIAGVNMITRALLSIGIAAAFLAPQGILLRRELKEYTTDTYKLQTDVKQIATSPSSSLVFIEFPEKAIAVGDSWTFPAPKNPIFGKEPQNLTAKLTGEKDFNGVKVWAIDVSGKLTINADIGQLIKDSGNAPAG